MYKDYDFCGWATRNDLRCSDGRIIRRDAFKHNDGDKVPLIWNHDHTSPSKLIGKCFLENRPEGVYTYGYLNNSKSALEAKEALLHGDIDSLSIYANHLQQNGSEVLHGSIKEVSLVLAGANPGACIEDVIEHMDGYESEAIITTGDFLELYHADEPVKEEEKVEEKVEEKEAKKKTETDDSEETVKDVIDSMTEKQKTVMYAVVGAALEAAAAEEKDEKDEKDEGDEKEMKHNLFEGQEVQEENVLTHSDIEAIFDDARENGSLKNAVLRHGITNISNLYTEDKAVNPVPEMVHRPDEWVSVVMNGVHRTPFSRIKSMYANLTTADARARGYIKGHLKAEEVFAVLKRSTPPTMIYKKQKIDRQDLIEIKDFDFVAWLKKEMRLMLDEEIARAILVGDGRADSSDDKIPETSIRPIWTDDDVYTVKKVITVGATDTEDEVAKAIIRGAIKSRKEYRGSGNPTLFVSEDYLSDMLLMEDTTGRAIYDTEEKLRTALRVKNIVSVPVMENLTRTVSGTTRTLVGIIVNLNDYNVGADKGGEVNLFDHFDIDYNAQKYLMETYCSGAMIRPYSAIALELVTGE